MKKCSEEQCSVEKNRLTWDATAPRRIRGESDGDGSAGPAADPGKGLDESAAVVLTAETI